MRIRGYRVSKNMTQMELAEKVGVSRSTVAMWENGSNVPSAELIPRIANALSCTTDQLFGIEKENPAEAGEV